MTDEAASREQTSLVAYVAPTQPFHVRGGTSNLKPTAKTVWNHVTTKLESKTKSTGVSIRCPILTTMYTFGYIVMTSLLLLFWSPGLTYVEGYKFPIPFSWSDNLEFWHLPSHVVFGVAIIVCLLFVDDDSQVKATTNKVISKILLTLLSVFVFFYVQEILVDVLKAFVNSAVEQTQNHLILRSKALPKQIYEETRNYVEDLKDKVVDGYLRTRETNGHAEITAPRRILEEVGETVSQKESAEYVLAILEFLGNGVLFLLKSPNRKICFILFSDLIVFAIPLSKVVWTSLTSVSMSVIEMWMTPTRYIQVAAGDGDADEHKFIRKTHNAKHKHPDVVAFKYISPSTLSFNILTNFDEISGKLKLGDHVQSHITSVHREIKTLNFGVSPNSRFHASYVQLKDGQIFLDAKVRKTPMSKHGTEWNCVDRELLELFCGWNNSPAPLRGVVLLSDKLPQNFKSIAVFLSSGIMSQNTSLSVVLREPKDTSPVYGCCDRHVVLFGKMENLKFAETPHSITTQHATTATAQCWTLHCLCGPFVGQGIQGTENGDAATSDAGGGDAAIRDAGGVETRCFQMPPFDHAPYPKEAVQLWWNKLSLDT